MREIKCRLYGEDEFFFCPHCNQNNGNISNCDQWEGADLEGIIEVECDKCGKEIEIERIVTYHYQIFKTGEAKGEA
jgi:transcription elongation factor Elf1